MDCQLCGNRTSEKFEIKETEEETFQLSLNKDQLPLVLDRDLLLCKACRIYLLWRVRKIGLHIKKDFIKLRNTVLKRYFFVSVVKIFYLSSGLRTSYIF